MKMRSLLFVPGDSERKFDKACESGADGLILDLEDAVSPANKVSARANVAQWLDRADDTAAGLFVRVNALDTGLTLADLAAVVRPGLAGIVIPKANGGHDLTRVSHYLAALEEKAGMATESVAAIVVATETPSAMFALNGYAGASSRLIGLTWGAEDLSSAIGATTNKSADGGWSFPYQMARAQCLFAAGSAGVAAIDTLYADFRDEAGLQGDCDQARRDGFTGRIAIHPAQVPTINRCFSPSEQDMAEARLVIEAFAAAPDAGTVAINGRMYDIPHLKAARRILAAGGDQR